MGEIRKDNLHESLIEELNELANIDLSGKQDKTDESLLTESKDVIGAINELFQNANNGKELIASAIGEPVSAEDTFQAMSNDINSLLSTFKTNMMNNGITVESGDKFKSLIDKIATMVEEGEGKGIQYATGDITGFNMEYNQTKNTTINIDFKPSFIFIEFADKFKNTNGSSFTLSSMVMSSTRSLVISLTSSGAVAYYMSFNINTITEESFNFVASTMYSIPSYTMVIPNAKWYAIGVGEEDTTLRDSLASILQEEGVSVSEEDDMASLITKVDEEFTKDNNTINNLTNELAGKVTPAGTAVAGDVLSGKTFMNSSGQLQTGNIPYLQSNIPNVNGNTANHYMTGEIQVGDYSGLGGNCIYFAMPTGVYNTVPWLMSYVPDLRPENIVSGKSICGVNGTASASLIVSVNQKLSLYTVTSGTINITFPSGLSKINKLIMYFSAYTESGTNYGKNSYILYPDSSSLTLYSSGSAYFNFSIGNVTTSGMTVTVNCNSSYDTRYFEVHTLYIM